MKPSRLLSVIAATGSLMVLAACGSSSHKASSTNSAGSSSSNTGSAAKGTPYNIGVEGPFGGTLNPHPEYKAAIDAYIAGVNSSGGVNGHPIHLTYCDDQYTVNLATSCFQTLTSNSSLVALIDVGIFDDAGKQYIDAVQIPTFLGSPVAAADYTDPLINATSGGVTVQYGAEGLIATGSDHSAKSVSIVYTSASVGAKIGGAMKSCSAAGGAKLDDSETFAFTQVDMSAPSAKLIQSNPDALLLSVPATQSGNIVKQVRSDGYKGLIVGGTFATDPGFMASLGSAANGIVGVSAFAPVTSTIPAMVAFKNGVIKYGGPSSVLNELTISGWVAAERLVAAMKAAPSITRSGIQTGLKSLTAFDAGGLIAPTNYSQPGPIPGQPDIEDTRATSFTYENGQFQWTGKFVDTVSCVSSVSSS